MNQKKAALIRALATEEYVRSDSSLSSERPIVTTETFQYSDNAETITETSLTRKCCIDGVDEGSVPESTFSRGLIVDQGNRTPS